MILAAIAYLGTHFRHCNSPYKALVKEDGRSKWPFLTSSSQNMLEMLVEVNIYLLTRYVYHPHPHIRGTLFLFLFFSTMPTEKGA
jgi:hypothetical protein